MSATAQTRIAPCAFAHIVPWEASYTHGLVALISRIQREEYGLPITPEQQPDLCDVPGFYLAGHGNFWVALDADGEVVGSIALKDIGGGNGALRKMFVRQDMRGREKGVATALLALLLDWAAKKGFASIFLGTTAFFLAAHKFYERNGFREIPTDELPPGFPLMTVDTRFYRLDLAQTVPGAE